MIIWTPVQESAWKWADKTLYHGSISKTASLTSKNNYAKNRGERYKDSPPAFFLTVTPEFALHYAMYRQTEKFNRNGYIYEFKLKKKVNIFDIANTKDKEVLLNYIKQNGNDLYTIALLELADEASWRAMETASFQWGMIKVGFDGWTMTEKYIGTKGKVQVARNLGIWDMSLISTPKIIPVKNFLSLHPKCIDKSDPLSSTT